MKRWTFRIVLCLLFGVVTTVGVAWGLAIGVRPTAHDAWRVPVGAKIADTPDELRIIAAGFGRRSDVVITSAPGNELMEISYSIHHRKVPAEAWSPPMRYDDPEVIDYTVFQPLDPIQVDLLLEAIDEFDVTTFISIVWGNGQAHIHDVSGWPMVALQSMESWSPYQNTCIRMGIRIRAESSIDQPDILPLRPILPGFLIDTLFYAVIWFGLFFGIGAVRRTIRRGRGRCVKCGYDLRGTPEDVGGPGAACSECGWGREDGTTNDELRATSEE